MLLDNQEALQGSSLWEGVWVLVHKGLLLEEPTGQAVESCSLHGCSEHRPQQT